MNLLMNVLENIKNEVVELNQQTHHRMVEFRAELCFEDQHIPTTTLSQSERINAFYQVTGISPLDIYVDKLDVRYTEEGFYDRHIQSMYLTYQKNWGGFWPIFPCILCRDFLCWTYNTFVIYPFVSQMFAHNPPCVYCNVLIVFRKSMVNRVCTPDKYSGMSVV